MLFLDMGNVDKVHTIAGNVDVHSIACVAVDVLKVHIQSQYMYLQNVYVCVSTSTYNMYTIPLYHVLYIYIHKTHPTPLLLRTYTHPPTHPPTHHTHTHSLTHRKWQT